MEEMSKIALAYYKLGTDEEKDLYKKFFDTMDADGDGEVSFREFSEFMMQQEGYEFIRTIRFFDQLDEDGSSNLDYFEVLTLYYIVKSGRPFCSQCSGFISGLYFTCMKCFNSKSRYSICLDCYCKKNRDHHLHGLENFLDNFAVLENHRKSTLAGESSNQTQPSSSSASGSSSSGGLAAAVRKRGNWKIALAAFEAGLTVASMFTGCTIM